MRASDFLDAPAVNRQSALAFLDDKPAQAPQARPQDDKAYLYAGTDPYAYASPEEVTGAVKKALTPPLVQPLPFEGVAAMHYAQDDASRLKVASKYLGRPESDFFVKDGTVYQKDNGAKVGGFGGKTLSDFAANAGKEAAGLAVSNPVSTALNVGAAALAPFTAGGSSLAVTANPLAQGGAAAADEMLRTYIGKRLLPQSWGGQPQDLSWGDAIRTGVVGGGAGALTFGLNRVPGLLQALSNAETGNTFMPKKVLAGLTPEAVQTGKAAMESSSIPLSIGQATNNPDLLSIEGRLRMLPQSIDVAKRAGEGQNQAAKDALMSFLERNASSTDPAMLGRNVVNAASAAIEQAKNNRSRVAGSMYDLAFLKPEPPAPQVPSMGGFVWTGDRWADPKTLSLAANVGNQAGGQAANVTANAAKLDVSPIVQGIDSKLNSQATPEAIRSLLGKARAQLLFNGAPRNTPEGLQAAKVGIDALIEGLDPKEAQARAALMGVKSDLMAYMDQEIPGFSLANRTYAEMSEPVNAMTDGLIGKVAGLGPDEAVTAPGKLFGNATTPAMVNDLKEKLGLTPQAWSDALMGKILQTVQGFKGSANGGPGNFSGQMAKQLGGSDASKAMWREAMTPQQNQEFTGLLDAMGAASRGSGGQSWTFAGKNAVEAMQDATQGPIDNAVLTALNAGKLMAPTKWAEYYRDYLFRKNAGPLADLLFNPPPNWARLVPVDPATLTEFQAATVPVKLAAGGMLSEFIRK